MPLYSSESLFYYFRIEDQVPENHLLRLINRYVSSDFVREKLRASYSEEGRPSMIRNERNGLYGAPRIQILCNDQRHGSIEEMDG